MNVLDEMLVTLFLSLHSEPLFWDGQAAEESGPGAPSLLRQGLCSPCRVLESPF